MPSISRGQVTTIAGGDLFEFGDVDGTGDDVRLQHPLGLFALGDKVLIADTYNHRIKQLDPQARAVKALFGAGKPGQADGISSSFYEPGGLSVANDKLYIADTNNHAIRVVDLKTKATSTLLIKDLQPPVATSKGEVTDESGPNSEEIQLALQPLGADKESAVIVQIDLPPGYHLNPTAPQRYRVSVEKGHRQVGLHSATQTGAVWREKVISHSAKNLQLPLRIPFRTFEPGEAELRVQLTLFYCREDNTGTCRIKTLVWRAPVEVTADTSAPHEVKIQGKLTNE